MITINNIKFNSEQIVSLLRDVIDVKSRFKTYRIKYDGVFIRINNKCEWTKISSAKSAFKAHLRRNCYVINRHVNQYATYTTPSFYYCCDKNDIDAIFNQLIDDNRLEFLEVTN